MRILYLTDRLSVRGGADRHLLQLIGWVVGSGFGVTVGCGRREAGVELPGSVRVARVRGLASATSSPAGLAGLEELLAGADRVHVQNVMNPVVLRAAAATGRSIVTIQDHRFFCPGLGKTLPGGGRCGVAPEDDACRICLADDGYRRRMLGLTAARLDAIRGARIVVLSHYMAAELEAVGVSGARVIPPAVEVREGPSEAGGYFLLAGRLVRHKAPLDALRAWELAGRPLPLRVAGEGPLAGELEGAIRLGWLDGSSLEAELSGARALLFPALWQEPFGILGVEALACGTPVIVADAGGAREWSAAGCIRVPQGDVDAMAEAVGMLAGGPGHARRLGEAGREMVRQRFGWRVVEPALEELYGG
ncbi:MAG: glycosyltransferase family 4 protein [Acidobacteria bacterium]|nr:glycosyltransferase family 4 protein [Acidobacteriota bacterium]